MSSKYKLFGPFLFLTLSLAPSSLASPSNDVAPDQGAVIEATDIIHYERLRGASRSQTLFILTQLDGHLKKVGSLPASTANLIELLRPLASDKDEEIAASALNVVSLLGPKATELLPVLQEIALDKEKPTQLRTEALNCLYKSNATSVSIPVFSTLLEDHDLEVRLWAAMALAEMDESYLDSTMPVLLESLKNSEFRSSTVSVLGSLGSKAKRSEPALKALLVQLKEEGADAYEINHVSRTILKVRGH